MLPASDLDNAAALLREAHDKTSLLVDFQKGGIRLTSQEGHIEYILTSEERNDIIEVLIRHTSTQLVEIVARLKALGINVNV